MEAITAQPWAVSSRAQPQVLGTWHLPSLTGNVLTAHKQQSPEQRPLNCLPATAHPPCTRQLGPARLGSRDLRTVMWASWWLWPLVAICTADRFQEEAKKIMQANPLIDG